MANIQSITYDSTFRDFQVVLDAPANNSFVYKSTVGQLFDINLPYVTTYPFPPNFIGASYAIGFVPSNKIFVAQGRSNFTFSVPLNFGRQYGLNILINGSIGGVSFSQTISDPTLNFYSGFYSGSSDAPGQATLFTAEKTVAIPGATGPGVEQSGGGSVTTTDIEFDYSAHLDRIVLALEQSATANTEMVNLLTQLNTKIDIIAQTSAVLKQQAETTGIHIIGPWEWLGYASIVKLFEEKGINLAELKAKVEAVTKSY